MADRKEPPFYNDDSVGAFQYKLPFYETMELFIETLTGTCFELRVSPFETVISVKAKIQRLEGIPVAQQHLIWNNLELEDEYCLHDYSIAEGCTLKLVLALRGGPINTRRVAMEDPVREMADLMDGGKEEGWEKNLPKKEVTFLVYREGDQLNFFRVVDRGDGTLTPVSESLGGSSVYNVYTEEEEYGGGYSAATQQALENGITKNKMNLLKSKMEDMNLNKKPKKSIKLKPRPPVGPRPPTSPRPCSSSLASPNARHQRLFRVLPQINQPHQSPGKLPLFRDQESTNPSPPGAASSSSSTHLSVTRRAPLPFTSSSCYMLQEEEPWEACPPLAKIRPPPKVSRLDVCGARLMRDCVYPQLPALSTRGQAEGTVELSEPMRDSLGLGLLEEAGGLMEPLRAGSSYGDLLSDPLSLDVSTPAERELDGLEPLEVGADRHLASTPTLLSQVVGGSGGLGACWGLGPADLLAGRGERTQLGIGDTLHIASPSPSSASTTPPPFTVQLPRPFEFTGSTLLRRPVPPPARPCDDTSPPSSSPPRSSRPRGVMVDSPGKRPEVISKSEARGITRMANQACKQPLGSLGTSELLASLAASRTAAASGREGLGQSLGLGLALPDAGASVSGRQGCASPALMASIQLLQEDLLRRVPPLHRAAASYMSSNSLGPAGGASSSARRLGSSAYHLPPPLPGSSTYHLPPVKAAVAGKKKSSRHCFLCGKKTGLASSYECRCGDNFCATHRYAETHDCSYDYKGTGRRVLQESNPIISAPKLPKI